MKQGVSKREKILLFSMGLLLILYLCIQFVILPLANRYFEGRQQRDNLISEKHRVEADINNRPAIESENREAGQRFEAIKSEYPLLVPNEEVDTILTNLCILNGFRVSGFRVTSPTPPRSHRRKPKTPPTGC